MSFDVIVSPSELCGVVTAPASKSLLHRAFIAAALSAETSLVHGYEPSEDVDATLRAIRAGGATVRQCGQTVAIRGPWHVRRRAHAIDVGDSASTLRLILPLFSFSETSVFTMGESLAKRPFSDYRNIFGNGVSLEGRTLRINAPLKPGTFVFDRPESSQTLSGLLFALPLCDKKSMIRVSNLGSKPYVDMTVGTLRHHGIRIDESSEGYIIAGQQSYVPSESHIEGDYSHAAMWLAAGLLHSKVSVDNLKHESLQGDQAIIRFIRLCGGKIIVDEHGYTTVKSPLKPFTVDVDSFPDLAPALVLMMAFASGTSKLVNAGRLAFKESRRLDAMVDIVNRLGGHAVADANTLTIVGQKNYIGGVDIDGRFDHRMIMMASVLSSLCKHPVRIANAHAVRKSYPGFFRDFEALGGIVAKRKR